MDVRSHRFLFLQGLATPFFSELGRALRAKGAHVWRVNFRGGDSAYWSGPSTAFRGRVEELEDFYSRLFAEHRFTDVVLFGDMRPVHRGVYEVAEKHQARVHVFEEGYIRPDWITLERDGVNGNSRLPQDSAWFLEAAKALPPLPEPTPSPVSFNRRAWQDFLYRISSVHDVLFHPHYQTHRPRRSYVEYAGWFLRFATFRFRLHHDRSLLARAVGVGGPVFLLPLQLNGDSQIVHHSPFHSVSEVIQEVVASFAANAPKNAVLIIKNHPLDTGLDGYRSAARRAAAGHGIGGRVFFIDVENLAEIFPIIKGVVLVNSTTGLSAIWRGIPVHAIANPIYKMPGLTFTGGLDDFWRNPEPPDGLLFEAFRSVLLHVNQLNGNFFTPTGIRLAIEGCYRHFHDPSPLERLVRLVNGHAGESQTAGAHS